MEQCRNISGHFPYESRGINFPDVYRLRWVGAMSAESGLCLSDMYGSTLLLLSKSKPSVACCPL